MKSPGSRLVTPLMFFSMMFLMTGPSDLAQSSPDPARAEAGGKAAQTAPAQTRPAGTRHTQTHPSALKKASKGADEKPIVITDEDLKKYHSGPARPATRPATAPAPSEDPMKPFRDQQERARWRQEKITLMQQRILDLEGTLKDLKQKRLSVVNPFVGRPAEGEEEKAAEKGLSGPELLARTDREIKQTTEDLESARKALATFLENTPE